MIWGKNLTRRGLASNSGHLANAFSRALSKGAMVVGLTLHGQSDQFQKMAVIVPVPEGRLDINLSFREKATSEVALSSQSQSIALGTKMIA